MANDLWGICFARSGRWVCSVRSSFIVFWRWIYLLILCGDSVVAYVVAIADDPWSVLALDPH